ncbi:hypothetical protein BJD58_gp64 [Gordonia phage UmaThurman]|uniref:hypothetical protein n=1 Tax=Gordonia phage UmaThurman TaxID=1821563 RepID=UPI00078DF234|nr:hypothetical protein BJD58_gp64 [Gordonia phage UmaThurman]AMS03964.1 hypothetical protein SEA_UMATHURMAN_64 [Gordonia phage UmaThurman]
MGSRWEVLAWADLGDEDPRDFVQYEGNSFVDVIRTVLAARRNGIGCITVKWRP